MDHAVVSFQFSETHRDDWSVYLQDDSRGVWLQLDLHTKKVMYRDKNTPQPWQLYTISSSYAKTNGWILTRIQFKGSPYDGWISQWVDGPAWRWEWADGTADDAWYDVVRREDWSVYLRNRSNRNTYQIDLETRTVYWAGAGEPRRPLYPIVTAK
jgi:hypothetical protein